MKIAVTGKGGVGKTTFAATLARLYADEGKRSLQQMWIRMRIWVLRLDLRRKPWILLFRFPKCVS